MCTKKKKSLWHKQRIESMLNYLASTTEIVKKFNEQASFSVFECKSEFFRLEKAGCWGEGKLSISFVSIETTSDIVGLYAASSWTHKRATLMYLITIRYDASCCNTGSISSQALSSFHIPQAWRRGQKIKTELSNFKWISHSLC